MKHDVSSTNNLLVKIENKETERLKPSPVKSE
jgi:hypothetical protein